MINYHKFIPYMEIWIKQRLESDCMEKNKTVISKIFIKYFLYLKLVADDWNSSTQ